jgi:anaerobic ribonucleoside-triphosphate reductase activating protein
VESIDTSHNISTNMAAARDGGERLIRVAEFLDRSDIYGPGMRSVIWVQGCTLACKGCWNTEFWAHAGGEMKTVSELHNQLMAVEGVEGVTILGGEPLQQAPALLDLLRMQDAEKRSIMLYSGYEENELNEVQQACVDLSDIVILGRYVESLRNVNLRWRGSTNQVLFSPTGRVDVEGVEDGEREVEFHIQSDGRFIMVGYPDPSLVEDLLENVIEELEGTNQSNHYQ